LFIVHLKTRQAHLFDGYQTDRRRYVVLVVVMVVVVVRMLVVALEPTTQTAASGAGCDGRGLCVAIHGQLHRRLHDEGSIFHLIAIGLGISIANGAAVVVAPANIVIVVGSAVVVIVVVVVAL